MTCRFATAAALLIPLIGSPDGAGAQAVPEPRGTVTPVTDRIVTTSAFLPVPPDEAFEFFTDDGRLRSWLAADADVEARVGGRYELFWDPADRDNDSTIGCRVTAIAPPQFLAFQWRSPRQYKELANAADPLTHVVVLFVPERAGTRVHLVHSGWRSDPQWEEARRWQERAWTGAFQQLERVSAR